MNTLILQAWMSLSIDKLFELNEDGDERPPGLKVAPLKYRRALAQVQEVAGSSHRTSD